MHRRSPFSAPEETASRQEYRLEAAEEREIGCPKAARLLVLRTSIKRLTSPNALEFVTSRISRYPFPLSQSSYE